MSATLAGLALDGAGAGLAHGIGHALGTIAGIHHGRAVALALDVIYQKNATTTVGTHAQIAAALGVDAGQISWGHVQVDHMYGHGPQFGRSP